ncbi:MAG: GNAT family N-acetyltransferase [Bacteroidota bacterium]|nr:GNAT family N-acetyltransferase [Bacteroidota bacterium]MDP4214927.1 GNAT family N-acetyltransferase [Bacteroidota bacterium]MDP4246617.1 GNAT family N-acetyltransferase [Bacteroidota bacterium]MDP4255378.1 GNAT family N-acetyltransferase [Bacteroidota bacterium]MDP4258854.1 GNAT family N-acetyltransferase [Bacteroidota bacterium]
MTRRNERHMSMDDPTLSIRFADLEDINTIGYLAQQVWPKAYKDILAPAQLAYMLNLFYSPASLRQQIVAEKHSFLVAEEEDEPIGFASWSKVGGGRADGAARGARVEAGVYKLHKLYVLPGRQGKGLGKAILGFIVEDIVPQGARALQLNVNRHNKAKQFYEKMGFAVIREEDVDIGQNYWMNDYVMEMKLGVR